MWQRSEPTPAPTDDFILSADLDRLARAHFYNGLRQRLELVGETVPASIFGSLARDSLAMLPDNIRRAGREPDPASGAASDMGTERDPTNCRTAYDAWAIAVDVENRAADRLIELLSRAKDVRAKLLLLGRAREAFRRVASHRVQRRAAFHAERISEARVPFPDVRRIQSVSDLVLVALAIEKWLLRLLTIRSDPIRANNNGIRLTRRTIERLEGLLDGRMSPRRLKKWLDRLDASLPPNEEPTGPGRFWQLKMTAEAGRVFDYYDRVFVGAESEDILSEAQALSRDALKRLQSIRDKLE